MLENRRHDRTGVALAGKLRVEGSEAATYDCEIIDLSPGGAKIRTDFRLDKNAAVHLQIEQMGEFGADVAWYRHPLAGLTFHAPTEVMTEVVMAVAMYR